jgi:hypothetical protein
VIVTGDLANLRSFVFRPFVLVPGQQLLLENDALVRIGGRTGDAHGPGRTPRPSGRVGLPDSVYSHV